MGKNVLHPFLSGIATAGSELSVNALLKFIDKSWLLGVGKEYREGRLFVLGVGLPLLDF